MCGKFLRSFFTVFEEETSLIEHELDILFVFCEWLTSKTMTSRVNILKDDEVEMGSLIFSC